MKTHFLLEGEQKFIPGLNLSVNQNVNMRYERKYAAPL